MNNWLMSGLFAVALATTTMRVFRALIDDKVKNRSGFLFLTYKKK